MSNTDRKKIMAGYLDLERTGIYLVKTRGLW